jgi:hypothetical protein
MQMRTQAIVAAAGVMALAGSAQAGFKHFEEMHGGSIKTQLTDWEYSVEVPQFDTKDGKRELLSVCVLITGDVFGSVDAESLDNEPATILVNLEALIGLSLGSNLLASVNPVASDSFKATAFDGAVDFGGTSGMMFDDMLDDEKDSAKIGPTDDDFGAFLGDGTVKLDASAMGLSSGSGAGNLVLQFNTQAGLEYKVIYKWVPTPGASALLGLAGITALRRRR